MLLQTNSYIVPKDKRTEHARLIKRFRALMCKLGCEEFDVCEQTGANWTSEMGGRFVQLMKFRDEAHQKSVREAEQSDASAQELVREFCELIDYAYQQQQGIATTAYYKSLSTAVGAKGMLAGASSHEREFPQMLPAADVLDDIPALEGGRVGVRHAAGKNGEIDD